MKKYIFDIEPPPSPSSTTTKSVQKESTKLESQSNRGTTRSTPLQPIFLSSPAVGSFVLVGHMSPPPSDALTEDRTDSEYVPSTTDESSSYHDEMDTVDEEYNENTETVTEEENDNDNEEVGMEESTHDVQNMEDNHEDNERYSTQDTNVAFLDDALMSGVLPPTSEDMDSTTFLF